MFIRSRPRSNSDVSDLSESSDWSAASHSSSSSSSETYLLAAIPAALRRTRTIFTSSTVDSTHSNRQQTQNASTSRSIEADPEVENNVAGPSSMSTNPSNVADNVVQLSLEDQLAIHAQMEVDTEESSDNLMEDNDDDDDDAQDEELGEDFDPENLDLSFAQLDVVQLEFELNRRNRLDPNHLQVLNLSSNCLQQVPESLAKLKNLRSLDLSQNQLQRLDEPILALTRLETLIASNNRLNEQSLPKNFSCVLSTKLKVLSLSGNQFQTIPEQIFELTMLRSLYLGANQITHVSRKIRHLDQLQNLYLGGNQLEEIPYEVGLLQNLQALSLCENRLRELPSSIAYLCKLKSLALHRNELTALPPEIVKLRSLYELSLRNNPLVVRFVRDMVYNPPSLLELAGRCIKINKMLTDEQLLPAHLLRYLRTAQRCVNPKCKGVYFDNRVEQIKFVDFCGIYRLPLLQYLCSPCCSSNNPSIQSSSSDDENELPEGRLRRVLLG